jgi:hypothetical protein
MIIRITGIDLLEKEKESDPEYLIFVEVGRILENGAEQMLVFNFPAAKENLRNHRSFIEREVRARINTEGPHQILGDTWATDDDELEIEFVPEKSPVTMAA